MSYEGEMLKRLKMPSRREVEEALIKTLFIHNGVITDFSKGAEIVDEIANNFNLSEDQLNAYLQTMYFKENRVKRSSLWHRLLFRAADSLAKDDLISRPSQTILLTNKREWMLTEKGFDKELSLMKIPRSQKDTFSVKSFEVQKIVKKLVIPQDLIKYDPIDMDKVHIKTIKEVRLEARAFRQAVIQSYDFKCAFCGLKIPSPDSLLWEVEAAHIVPHSFNGKNDILNGLALCHIHHWAFDTGWLSLADDFTILVSPNVHSLSADLGKIGQWDIIRMFSNKKVKIYLPDKRELYPHFKSIRWHRENNFSH